jgi:hypothetical protein
MPKGRKMKIEDYKVIHTYNNDPNAPTKEEIIHRKEFVEYLYNLVNKYNEK